MTANVVWPPTEEEQLVAKRRDMTFAMLLRAWLLRHRAAQLLGDARRAKRLAKPAPTLRAEGAR